MEHAGRTTIPGRFAITATVRTLVTVMTACILALLFAPSGAAQPAPVAPGPVAVSEPQPVEAAPESVAACRQFARALDTAAVSYSEFANVLAIGQKNPDYLDPIVSANNSYGRTGLRAAATTALDAARTPGLQPDIAAPMRSWSMGAMKLILLMGLRADVDRFNNAANDLNTHTEAAQMACARAGTQA